MGTARLYPLATLTASRSIPMWSNYGATTVVTSRFNKSNMTTPTCWIAKDWSLRTKTPTILVGALSR